MKLKAKWYLYISILSIYCFIGKDIIFLIIFIVEGSVIRVFTPNIRKFLIAEQLFLVVPLPT